MAGLLRWCDLYGADTRETYAILSGMSRIGSLVDFREQRRLYWKILLTVHILNVTRRAGLGVCFVFSAVTGAIKSGPHF